MLEALGCGTKMQLLEYTVEAKPQTVRVTGAKHVVDDITAAPVFADNMRQLAAQGAAEVAERRGRRGLLQRVAQPLVQALERDNVDIALARRRRRVGILSSAGQGSLPAPQPLPAPEPQPLSATAWCPWTLASVPPATGVVPDFVEPPAYKSDDDSGREDCEQWDRDTAEMRHLNARMKFKFQQRRVRCRAAAGGNRRRKKQIVAPQPLPGPLPVPAADAAPQPLPLPAAPAPQPLPRFARQGVEYVELNGSWFTRLRREGLPYSLEVRCDVCNRARRCAHEHISDFEAARRLLLWRSCCPEHDSPGYGGPLLRMLISA